MQGDHREILHSVEGVIGDLHDVVAIEGQPVVERIIGRLAGSRGLDHVIAVSAFVRPLADLARRLGDAVGIGRIEPDLGGDGGRGPWEGGGVEGKLVRAGVNGGCAVTRGRVADRRKRRGLLSLARRVRGILQER